MKRIKNTRNGDSSPKKPSDSNIDEQVKKVEKRVKEGTEKDRISKFINQDHPRDVNTITEISNTLGMKRETVKRHAHSLVIERKIHRVKVPGLSSRYYGTKESTDAFRNKLQDKGIL
jgi:predicted ArsR family transcriptional regulator